MAGAELMHPKQLEEIECLRHQSELIFNGEFIPEIIDRLKRHVPDLAGNLFLFDHIIDQGEDFYTLISSDGKVYRIEVPRRVGTGNLVKVTTCAELSKEGWGKDEGQYAIKWFEDGTVHITEMAKYEDTGEIVEVTTFADFSRLKVWSKVDNRRLDAIRFLLTSCKSR